MRDGPLENFRRQSAGSHQRSKCPLRSLPAAPATWLDFARQRGRVRGDASVLVLDAPLRAGSGFGALRCLRLGQKASDRALTGSHTRHNTRWARPRVADSRAEWARESGQARPKSPIKWWRSGQTRPMFGRVLGRRCPDFGPNLPGMGPQPGHRGRDRDSPRDTAKAPRSRKTQDPTQAMPPAHSFARRSCGSMKNPIASSPQSEARTVRDTDSGTDSSRGTGGAMARAAAGTPPPAESPLDEAELTGRCHPQLCRNQPKFSQETARA